MPTGMEEQLGDERISAPKSWQRFPAQVSSQRAGAKGAYRCGIAWDCVGWLGELIMRETSSYPLGDGSKPWYLVNPKIAGKWMFIPLKMYL